MKNRMKSPFMPGDNHFIHIQIAKMKTILAPTDFSSTSINAVNYAADLAVSINAKLVLFHAVPFPMAVAEFSLSGDFFDDMLEAAERDMNNLYEEIARRTENKITVTTDIKIGKVEREIEEVSSLERPLAIVLGIRSGKSIERALMGSSIFHVMNHIGFPALIIPEDAEFHSIKAIGIACDLARTDIKLPLETVKEWLHLFKASLDIITVSDRDKQHESAQVTTSISLQNRLNSFKPRFHFLTSDHIAEELNEFVSARPLDLLLVIPRKHGILNLFHKRNSRNIVAHSHLPILSIHSLKN